MKKFILFTCFFGSLSLLSAQNPGQNFQQQFGFDAAGFLSRFFNFSNNSGSGFNTPYYLTYRKLGEKKNVRIGLGLSFSVEGNGDGKANSFYNLNFRAGKERFNDFGKRWRAFYGWDYKLFFNYNINGSSSNKALSAGTGIAPIFGLQWRLNERLSFSTEIAYNLFLTYRNTNGNDRFGGNTSFSHPTAVYVQYDF